ncbi:DUF1189 domain-containing protein [Carnobacterium gallinarum]|uniref:DUF1189 domain-containing protein n=1 Tax=Carnobacterium gallinarum TaxID=2749 RepID=UPI00055358BD|nr:maltodextrose utilization protein MalA [Carnobacterium gallinarum]
MSKTPFPFNYFNSILTPKSVFKGRHNLNWFQNFVIFIFLNALLMIPVSLYFTNSTNFQLQEIMPNTMRLVTDEFAEKMAKQSFEAGKLIENEPFEQKEANGIVGIQLAESAVKETKNVISFEKNHFLIKDETGYSFEVRYSDSFTLKKATTKNALKEAIKQEWFKQNRAFVAFTMMIMTATIIIFSNILVMFIAAFFIWMTKKNALSSIKTYKESFNLVLNAAGLGSFFALLIGLYHFDMTILIGIQSLGLVLMLTAVFAATHFNENPRKITKKAQK